MITRRFKKRAAIICLGMILALLILGVAAFPRAEVTFYKNASGEVDRMAVVTGEGKTIEGKKVP